MTAGKPRRVIAADTAHAWARGLPLANPLAKSVLRALANYCNGEGACYVGLDQLAADTDLTIDTVRRRLVWLEEVGVIRRTPQWINSAGQRTGDGCGRRTTDEIGLLMNVDRDEVERRCKNQNGDNLVCPIPGIGQTPVSPPVSPPLALALRPGPESSEHEREEEGRECARAREPLLSEAAKKLADKCLIALGLDPEQPPDGWHGLAYDCEVLVKRGCDPPLVVATFAQFRGRDKPKPYILKAVDTAHKNQSGPYAKTRRSDDRSAEPTTDWRSSKDAFRRARADLKANIAADDGRQESG